MFQPASIPVVRYVWKVDISVKSPVPDSMLVGCPTLLVVGMFWSIRLLPNGIFILTCDPLSDGVVSV